MTNQINQFPKAHIATNPQDLNFIKENYKSKFNYSNNNLKRN